MVLLIVVEHGLGDDDQDPAFHNHIDYEGHKLRSIIQGMSIVFNAVFLIASNN